MKTKRRYTVDGITYDSPEEMPPHVRQRWDSMAEVVAAMEKLAEKGIQPQKTANVRFESTTLQSGITPTERPWWIPESGPALSGGTSQDTNARTRRRTSRVMRLIVLPSLALALIAMCTNVHTTVRYVAGWWIAYALLMLGMLPPAWHLRRELRQRFFPYEDPSPRKVIGKVLAGLLGCAALLGGGLFRAISAVTRATSAHSRLNGLVRVGECGQSNP